jgi:DNA ligase-1
MSKPLPTLFSRTSTGAIQEWTIEVSGDRYRTVYGQTDGKKIETEWTVAKPKNEGRANARTAEQQAQSEAKALWKKKQESGYWENVADIDRTAFIEPMLAQKYEDRKDEIVFPVYCQPKLDGIRCITSIEGMQSRNGKSIVSCPHIYQKLKKVFKDWPSIVFDGELYCDKLNNDFNKITSLVKKTKPTENDLMESDATIQYWIYDVVNTGVTFSERTKLIEHIFKKYDLDSSFVRVETYIANDSKGLDMLYESWIDAGYEGQMVRVDRPYEQKRSAFLLKRKEFQDREYPIVDVCEGEGNKTGMAGYMVLRNDDGETFRSNIKGDRAYLRELLSKRDSLIGKPATVKFFNLTPDKKVPRFPYVIKIREDFDV